MSKSLRVLIIEDSEDDAALLAQELRHGGYDPVYRRVDTGPALTAALAEQTWDIVISDYSLPKFSGPAALKRLQESGLDLPFILVSGVIGEDVAVEAMKAGAHDCIMKYNLKRLIPAVERELREAGERRNRKKAEEELRRTEQYYRVLIENASDITAMLSADLTIQYVSPSAERLLHYRRGELIGQSGLQLVHPDDAPRALEVLAGAVKSPGTTYTLEMRLRSKENSWLIFEILGKYISIDPTRTGIVLNVRDVTERRRTEEQLRQSEERFREVAENIYEVFFLTGPMGTPVIYISPAYEGVWGRTCQSLYEHPEAWRESVHPEDRSRVEAQFGNDPENFKMEYRIVRPDGSIRWIWARTFPIRDEKGVVHRVAGIAEDITQRKLAGDALKESEERLRMAIDTARMHTWDWDVRTDRLIRSGHYEAVYGPDLPDSGGTLTSFLQMIHPEDREKFSQAVDRAFLQGGSFDPFDFRFIQPNGDLRWLETQGRAVKDHTGKVVRLIGVTQDVTQRKRAQQELEFRNTILLTQQEASPDAILVVDEEAKIISYNKRFIDLWNIPDAMVRAAVDEPVLQSVVREMKDPEAFLARVKYLYGHREEKSHEELMLTDGRIVDRYSAPMFGADGRYFGRVWYFRDITDRKREQEALIRSEERFRQIAESIREVFWMTNAGNDEMLYVSPGYEKIWGRACKDLYERPQTWLDSIHPEDRYRVLKAAKEKQGQGTYDEEYRIIQPDGSIRWIRDRAFPVRDAAGQVYRITGIAEDITERREAEAMVQHAANYDTLTGLPNRTMFYNRLLNGIRTDPERGRRMALLLVDLARFREINDTLGHERGDEVLRSVGRRLREAMFDRDVVARPGGDEFSILLLNLENANDIDAAVQKILKALNPSFLIDNLPIRIETCIGIALYPDHGETAEALFRRADIALNLCKRTGIPYAVYDPAKDKHSPQRLALMAELHYAIEHNELRLYHQPIIDMKTRHTVAAEALVRWKHPLRGLIPPDQFILPAEQTGLIHPLTRWVMAAGMRQCKAWHEAGMELTVSVNLSARNLLDPKLPALVAEQLQSAGVNPGWMRFEITESAIMADPVHALDVLTKLHEMGIRLSIDDFGTGYSSLFYLQKLPVDTIKIDKSFIINMGRNQNDVVIVRSTIDLAHSLGLRAIAEGVETQDLWDRLSPMGCDAAQGYYISKPLPSEEFTRWIHESPWGLSPSALSTS
ncbi:MAG TPA: PAS domain-containing protein [Nitrospiria bacterium]|nr:PAS domain-containing protein [Nitrospiria bacterium]